jgi:hypothetical protein
MMRRALLVVAALTATGVATGAAAVLPLGTSAPIQVVDVDAPRPTTVPTTTTATTTTPPDDGQGHGDKKVWVCVVLVHQDGSVRLKPGKNPIDVAVTSRDARDAASPDHPSYVVENGSVVCRVDGKAQTTTGR